MSIPEHGTFCDQMIQKDLSAANVLHQCSDHCSEPHIDEALKEVTLEATTLEETTKLVLQIVEFKVKRGRYALYSTSAGACLQSTISPRWTS